MKSFPICNLFVTDNLMPVGRMLINSLTMDFENARTYLRIHYLHSISASPWHIHKSHMPHVYTPLFLFNQDCCTVWPEEVHRPNLIREHFPQPGTVLHAMFSSPTA